MWYACSQKCLETAVILRIKDVILQMRKTFATSKGTINTIPFPPIQIMHKLKVITS